MDGTEEVLLVAVCVGQRCEGLRRLSGAEAHRELRTAVRERSDAVLLHTACQGMCHRASIATVGRALSGPGRLSWSAPPLTVGVLEAHDRAATLADWVRESAPERAPAALMRDTV